MKELISICEKKFIENAIREGTRLDGRKPDEFRELKINFGADWGSCYVTLGETSVLAQVSCEIQQPKASRPNEGLLNINIELSPMAAPFFEAGRQSELSVQLNRLLEKCIKDSRAVDLESLCISTDSKVWALRVDVNVLNHEGNIIDCASVAALAALAHFRRPDVSITGEQITVHKPEEQDPIPIIIHHYPVYISFALFEKGSKIIADPTYLEESVAEALLFLGINSYNELCGLHLNGNALASPDLVLQCTSEASKRSSQIVSKIKESVKKDIELRNKSFQIGFSECLRLNKITSLTEDSISVKLRKTKLNEVVSEMNIENKPDKKPNIVFIGKNTAGLVPEKDKSIFEGGNNTWKSENGSDSESSDDLQIINELPASKKQTSISQENKSNVDSEEDEVVILDCNK